MAMYKLQISPEAASYSVAYGSETAHTKLDGGSSRFRKDTANASSDVSCVWFVDVDGYEYMRAFYRIILDNGSLPFLIDLIIDNALPIEYIANFIPGTFQLADQSGTSYKLAATLEVRPSVITDTNLAAALNNYPVSLHGFADIKFTYPNLIIKNSANSTDSIVDWSNLFIVGHSVTVGNASFTYSGTRTLNGTYVISATSTHQLTLTNPVAVNGDWTYVNSLTDHTTGYINATLDS